MGITISGVGSDNLRQFIQELVTAVVQRGLNPDKVAIAVNAAGVGADDELPYVFADALWWAWLELHDEGLGAVAIGDEDSREGRKTLLGDLAMEGIRAQLVGMAWDLGWTPCCAAWFSMEPGADTLACICMLLPRLLAGWRGASHGSSRSDVPGVDRVDS